MSRAQLTPPIVDASGKFGYIPALVWLYENYRLLASADDVIQVLGSWIQDISDTPEIQALRSSSPIPLGFRERTFSCPDPIGRKCELELTWQAVDLVNVRAMLHFPATVAFLGRRLATMYFRRRLAPAIASLEGAYAADDLTLRRLTDAAPGVYDQTDVVVCRSDGLLVVARVVTGMPAVATYIIDERYA